MAILEQPPYAVFPQSDATVRKYWANHLRIQQIARTFTEFVHDLDVSVNLLPPSWKFEKISPLKKKKRIQ